MYFKVFCFFVVLSAAVAHDDNHHEKTESSTSITHHNKHLVEQEYKSLHEEGHHGHHRHPHDPHYPHHSHHSHYPHQIYHYHHHYHTHPKYEFEYKVEDHHTGDIKSQHETRDGDVIKGFYTLHQPDSHERVVHYHGDHNIGFHADVKYRTHHHNTPKHHH